MKHTTRTFAALALVIALTSAASARAADGAERIPTSGEGAGSTRALNQDDYGSPGDTRTDSGAGTGVGSGSNSNATTRSNSGKTNGLNMGTNSGANSDVKSGLSRSRQNGR
jgi:hypothetical protein